MGGNSSRSPPSAASSTESSLVVNQTGSGAFLYRSALNGDVCIYRKQLADKSTLSVEFLQEIFSNVMEERKKRGFKAIISLHVVFCKADKEDEVTDPPVVLKSNAFTCLDGSSVDECMDIALGEINEKIDEFIRNGSGWVLHHLDKIDLGILKYNPLKASSYIELPKRIENRRACLNIKNEDQKCFLWSVLAALHPVQQHANRVAKYTQFEEELTLTNITFPMKVKDINKFEKLNPTISINVLGYEDSDIFPLRITGEVKEHHINLLMFSSEEKSHYVLIRHLSRLVSSQMTAHNHEKFYCNFCLHGFIREDLLNAHMEYCKV